MTDLNRRELLAGAAAALLVRPALAQAVSQPVAVSSANGLRAVTAASKRIAAGMRPVHAAVAGVSIVESDPEDMSVGYGGLPNEEGVVELDACVMDGTRGLGGAVAALRNIKNPSRVALRVMERTDHVLLVGKGAYRFARAHGFAHEELLTDAARKRWLKWKENLSEKDDWVPEHDGGTISCLARAPDGRLGGSTTTSGLAYKIPGRVGDSPILGAGLYVDDSAGAAGATGRGEACILSCASFLAVEAMRRGASPGDAALESCQRIVERTKDARLRDAQGRPRFNVQIYCLRRDGLHGAASIWSGSRYAARDAEGARILPAAHLIVVPD
jgi:N4-(beta-N-acetylglucosaminyl)-L-asparaginase